MKGNRERCFCTVFQLFMLLFIVFSSMDAQAQQYSLGIRGGGSITWPTFGDTEAQDVYNRRIKPGFHAGVLLGFPLKAHYDLLLEAGISQRGRVLTFNDDNDWENHLTLRMADMGMMLRRSFKFMLRKNTPADAFFSIGPEINYWISGKGYLQVGEGPKYKYTAVFEDDPAAEEGYSLRMREINRWLFALGVGVGVKMPLHKRQYLTTEIRFLSGHTFLGKATSSYNNFEGIGLLWGEGMMQDTMKTNLKTVNLSIAYTLDFDVKESRKGKSTIKRKLKR